ncbi:hypothetical protein SDC9_160443 [bioreactor metagenome]|uniref:DUF218 domain-containing protein n=1 Tax=bioreactor metagenome TaxID=1076179 RepID=A0A645FLP5_9ZZZZ|nr:ElyC/SanA/YdcF family protein [Candidatus Metalachnospira sp.]
MKKPMKIIKFAFAAAIAAAFVGLGINEYIIQSTKAQIVSAEEITDSDNIDCALVLGAGVRGDEPSDMLADRLDTAIALYNRGTVHKLLMSGDHGQTDYDEVHVMRSYAMEKGVPSEDIFMDHAGFSTYESVYRARDVFAADKIIIVTQQYHLYRALYIANKLGVTAYGVSADLREYIGQPIRELREILARDKDVVSCIIKPEPKYLGDVIPVSGDGNVTEDKDIN